MPLIPPPFLDLRAGAGSEDIFAWARSRVATAPAHEIYRQREGRTTLRFHSGGRAYFLKYHAGVGWNDIFRNLLRLKLPVPGASVEYAALQRLEQNGVASLTVCGFGERGFSPSRRESFLVTEALVDTLSLEHYCAAWAERPPEEDEKGRLIDAVAALVRSLHDLGVNHRDLYLDHIHLDLRDVKTPRCVLIDLHRAQMRRQVPRRCRRKDLAALYFSAFDLGLQDQDLRRFMRAYEAGRATLGRRFWLSVAARAQRVYRREGRRWLRRTLATLDSEPADNCDWPRRVRTAEGVFYLKRYRPRDLLRQLALRLGLSRLQRTRRLGLAMVNAGLPVVPTHALLVDRVTCYASYRELSGAQELGEVAQGPSAVAVFVRVARALADLHLAGFVHGDCKWSNILVRQGDPYFIDLDGARRSVSRKRRLRDLARFVLEGEERGLALETDGFVDAYALAMGQNPEHLLLAAEGILRKLRARHGEKYGHR